MVIDPLTRDGVGVYGYGRIALIRGMELMGFQGGDEILVPEYLCKEVTDSIDSFGFKVTYYRMQMNLCADVGHVRSRIGERTKGVLAVHYFGFAQPLEQMREICRQNGIYLIEDNAHGFLSSHAGTPLGVYGDIGILSMRKTLLTRDGAALIVNAPELRHRAFGPPVVPKPARLDPLLWVFEKRVREFTARRRRTHGLIRGAKRIVTKALLETGRWCSGTADRSGVTDNQCPVSSKSWWELSRTKFGEVVRKRRANFIRLLDWLRDVDSCQIVHRELPEGICPQVFPILLEDGQKTISELRERGVAADYWPDLPTEVGADPGMYPVANYLRAHLVTLPVGQWLRVSKRRQGEEYRGDLCDRLAAAYRC